MTKEKENLLMQHLQDLKSLNEQCKIQVINLPVSHGKFSHIKNFIKKTIRKLLRWYYMPIINNQIALNDYITNTTENLINSICNNEPVEVRLQLYRPAQTIESRLIIDEINHRSKK